MPQILQMLPSLLAKIGADTAENERNFAKILPKIRNYPTGPLPRGPALGVRARAERPNRRRAPREVRRALGSARAARRGLEK